MPDAGFVADQPWLRRVILHLQPQGTDGDAHGGGDMVERDDNQQRPDQLRQYAEHMETIERQRMGADEAFPKGIERRGGDIARDHAGRGDHHRQAGRVSSLEAGHRAGDKAFAT